MLAEPVHIFSPCESGGRSAIEYLLTFLSRPIDIEHGRDATFAESSRNIDSEDIRRSLGGDGEAFRRIVERHQSAVGRMIWRFTRDRTEHEELTHQVFVEAYLSLPGYRAKAPFAHWLARIATRVGYRYWKQMRRSGQSIPLPDEKWDAIVESPDDESRAERAAGLVHRLLGQLPPRDRLVLTLRYLEQCDVEQTAYRTGWTQTLVRVQTHRAIRKLKTLASEAGIELDEI